MVDLALARDTVVVEENVHAFYRELTEGNNPTAVPFRTMKDVFMYAACLGFQQGQPQPLQGKRITIFRWAQFTPQTDIPLLKALAILGSREDVTVLLRQEEMLSLAEQYANAGIHQLRSAVLDGGSQPLWNLVHSLST